MKKMLEESFLTIEQMGYGIIDPVLAHWEVEDTPKEKMNLSDPQIHGQNSPILFDDVWLEEYYEYVQQMLNKNKEQEKWQDLVATIENFVKSEGLWGLDVPLDVDEKAQVEKAVKHYAEEIEGNSIQNAFKSYEEWPDKTVDILSWPESVSQVKREDVVIELPIKIYSPYGRIVLSGTITPASEYGSSNVKNLLAHIPKNIDTRNIKASVINGELLLELPG
ncbi:MAG TPA: hypothetical protein DD791_14375 [Syntrophomonas sp.]|jgi:hypothetical protein|nr:hypothetical protein [Syntrophomonas sp.]